jgi:hypothetical protein
MDKDFGPEFWATAPGGKWEIEMRVNMTNLELSEGKAVLLIGARRLEFDAADVELLEAMLKHLKTKKARSPVLSALPDRGGR